MTGGELAIGRFLRWAGVLALFLAGVTFLVEGWTDPHLLPRQLAWAGITLALVVSGVLSARRFEDAPGARVCLGLAAATIPLHFAQLGSALFELHEHGATTPSSVALSAVIVLLLAPALALGGAALVRRWTAPFTVVLFALGCPLLLTTRAGDTIAWIGLVELSALAVLERFVLSRRADLEGVEGAAVRALLCVPLFILLGRNALHEVTLSWLALSLATPGTLLVMGAKWLDEARGSRNAAEVVGGALLAAAACLASGSWASAPVAIGGALLIAVALSRDTLAMRIAGWAGSVALGAATVSGFGGTRSLTTLAALGVGAGYVALAYRRRALAWCVGSACCTFGLGASLLVSLVTFPVYFGWLLPAVVGLVLLVLGSSVQSPHSRGGRAWLSLSQHFAHET